MIFQFEHLKLWDYEHNIKFSPKEYKKILANWQYALDNDGWNALFIENHDIPRSCSSWGDDKLYWKESAKSFATSYFLQKGTPFIYQGQEIGMTNTIFNTLEDFKDIKSINEAKEKLQTNMPKEKNITVSR